MISPTTSRGVLYLREPSPDSFSDIYHQVRKHEGRIYPDDMVKNLPFTDSNHLFHKEWQLRTISSMRLHQYIAERGRSLKILEIKCGNGWLSNLLAQANHSCVTGIDINHIEIEQAARVFGDCNRLTFIYGNFFDDILPESDYDIIVMAATIQYFPDIAKVMEVLKSLLSEEGEIHILDSPIYTHDTLKSARSRSAEYYKSIDYIEMDQFYYHHSIESLRPFKAKLLYDPHSFLNRLNRKILPESDSPFPWIMIKIN